MACLWVQNGRKWIVIHEYQIEVRICQEANCLRAIRLHVYFKIKAATSGNESKTVGSSVNLLTIFVLALDIIIFFKIYHERRWQWFFLLCLHLTLFRPSLVSWPAYPPWGLGCSPVLLAHLFPNMLSSYNVLTPAQSNRRHAQSSLL